jgi:acyl-CoA thioester hydrolase
MPAVFETRVTVSEADLDQLGHVNNLVYLRWMQDVALAHSAAQGWPAKAYHDLGAGWVVRTHHIEYRLPALLGDEVLLRTWVADMKKVTSLRRYRILRVKDTHEATLAVAETDWAFVNYTTGLPKRIPPEVAGAFEVVADVM